MTLAVVAHIGAGGRIVRAEALRAVGVVIAVAGARGVAWPGCVIAGSIAVTRGIPITVVIAVVPRLRCGDGAAHDRTGNDARSPATAPPAPAAPPLHNLDRRCCCVL